MLKRPPKKSEVIELRLPYETKAAFMAKVRQEGVTASAVLRRHIDVYLQGSAKERNVLEPKETPMRRNSNHGPMFFAGRRWRPAIAALTTLIGLGTVVLTISPANAVPDLTSAFKHLDTDGNGVLTQDEFKGAISHRESSLAAPTHQPVVKPMDQVPPGSDVLLMVGQPGTGSASAFIAALAQNEPPSDKHVGDAMWDEFTSADSNGDGLLGFGEFFRRHGVVMAELFDSVDKDQDGFADAMELKIVNADGSIPADFIRAVDSNADGKLSRLEFTQH